VNEVRTDPLTLDEIRSFARDGFLLPGPVLTSRQVGRLHDAIDRALDDKLPVGVGAADLVADRADGAGAGGKSFPILVGLHKSVSEFRDVATHAVLTQWAGQLLGCDEVVHLADQAFVKPPGASSAELHWHQDWYPYPLETPDVLTCWIALDDVTVANGAMWMAVGTAGLGQYVPMDAIAGQPAPRAERYLEQGMKVMPDPEAVGIRAQPIEIKAGECSIHHCLTWHKSGVNTSGDRRRAIAERYVDGRAIWAGAREDNQYAVNQYPSTPAMIGRPIAENHLLTVLPVPRQSVS
jgi:phytanoyl-CoA hydroxylase